MPKTPSPLAAALAAVPTKTRMCGVAVKRDELEPDDRAQLDAAVQAIRDHRRINGQSTPGGPSVGWLHGVLNANGVTVSKQAVQFHVAGTCSCGDA